MRLSGLEFCETVQPILESVMSDTKFAYTDDFCLEGEASTVAADVENITKAYVNTGLHLNPAKCEITARNFDCIRDIQTFSAFKKVEIADLVMLGAPVMKGRAVDSALESKVCDLERAISRLKLLPAQDALVLLRNSLAMPKLLYTLRTSPCAGNPLLTNFDGTLRNGLSAILNVHLSDDQWIQASRPVQHGWLGLHSACMLAPSAFLASAAATLDLQNAILPSPFHQLSDHYGREALDIWSKSANIPEPVNPANKIQKVWDAAITSASYRSLLTRSGSETDTARLLAASAPHSGDWLQAPPITAIGLRLTDEMIRVAVGFRLGANTCEPHECVCGSMVDARGLHGLCCKKSALRH